MSDAVNRRDFLAAGTALAGTLAVQSAAFAASNDAIKVGVIGCGGRGTGAAFNILEASPDTEIAALADVFPDRLNGARNELSKQGEGGGGDDGMAARAQVPDERCFTGFDAYQKVLALPDIDIVILAMPPGFRAQHFAAAIESATAPITAFLIAPIAEFLIIPYMDSDGGRATWGWLLGDGEARGIALIFLFAGLILVAVGLLAFLTPSYRILSAEYEQGLAEADAQGDTGAASGDEAGEDDETDADTPASDVPPIDVDPPSTKDVIGGVVDGRRRA